MKKVISIFLILLLVGCNRDSVEKEPVIYTTIYPIEYIVDSLIGDEIEVKTILPLGSDAHTYEPTQQQVIDVANSDMYFYLGLGLEGMASKMHDAIEKEEVVSIEVGESLNLEGHHHDHEDEHEDDDHSDEHEDDNHNAEHEEHDMHTNHHVWLDPSYMIEITDIISDALINQYPNLEETIKANKVKLVKKLEDIDLKYKETLNSTELKVFIVSHDAFAHFNKYGIESIPVKDEVHSKDPTLKEIQEIIEHAKKENLEYIVYEQNIPCLPANVIMDELGLEKEVLHNLSVRTKLDKHNNKDYIKLMEDNLDVLIRVLNRK